jgi:RCC1 and BTB domain-containing protein
VASLLDDLRQLVNNPSTFPDVTFLLDGEPVHAHRSILTARSEHFRAMFSSGMKESREGVIPFPDWTKTAFVSMLEFLYTGSVRELTTPVALELLGLADHIGLDGLRALSETALVHSVDVANVCTLVAHAHRFGAPELKRFCMEFILKHSDTVALDPLADSPLLLIEITRLVLARNKTT